MSAVIPAEIRRVAQRIKCGKVTGPDGLPSMAVKVLFKEFPTLVAADATYTLCTGRMPHSWKIAEVVLIPKANGGFLSKSLISALAKGIEAIIEERHRFFAGDHDLLSLTQYGCRKGWSDVNAN